MYINRINKLIKLIEEKDAGGVIISDPKNIYYFSGFNGINEVDKISMLYCTREKSYLLVPRMFKIQAEKLDLANSNIEIIYLKERIGYIDTVKELMNRGGRILFEDYDLKVAAFNKIKEKLDCELVEIGEEILKLRMIKDEDEITNIRNAVELTDKTYSEIIEYLKSVNYNQVSELDLENKIEEIGRKLGGEGVGFDSVVANGESSNEPHYYTAEVSHLKSNNILLLDFGIKYKQYSGDLTRCIYLGDEIDKEIQEIYDIVLEQNEFAISKCKPGIKFIDIHNEIVENFKKLNLDKYFTHSIGHGLGLDIHERPFVRLESGLELQKNMILTIEPGLYFGDNEMTVRKFGIRVEDVVRITENGCEVLNKQDNKGLIKIPLIRGT